MAATLVTPKHDFNNTWGSIPGVTELDHRPMASSLMDLYWRDPTHFARTYSKVLSKYTIMFERFFDGTLPISFHGHVTDAISPTTIAGMMMRLAIVANCDHTDSIHTPSQLTRAQLASILGWTELHLESPTWAVIEHGYAAGFGSMANLSEQPAFRDHATGHPSVKLKLIGQTQSQISDVLVEVKKQGCIGVVVEIVNNQFSGRVTTPEELKNLSGACRENGLLLAVDETITALRCGAPFAHQRPEYKIVFKPDLVFFGKAIGINGVAINFDGPYIKRLNLDSSAKKLQAIYDWQSVVTQAVHPPLLIDAIGILEMASAGEWPERARIIGQHLRHAILERARSMKAGTFGSESEILGGLDSFIFVHKKVAATFLVMGASNAGPWVKWVRWLPRLDSHMTNKATVEAILSPYGATEREQVSARFDTEGSQPQWCFYCGNSAREIKYPWCRTCCVATCDAEECIKHLLDHQCLLSERR